MGNHAEVKFKSSHVPFKSTEQNSSKYNFTPNSFFHKPIHHLASKSSQISAPPASAQAAPKTH